MPIDLAALIEGALDISKVFKISKISKINYGCFKAVKLVKRVIVVINGMPTNYLWKKSRERT